MQAFLSQRKQAYLPSKRPATTTVVRRTLPRLQTKSACTCGGSCPSCRADALSSVGDAQLMRQPTEEEEMLQTKAEGDANVARSLHSGSIIQPKLKIGAPDVIYEREADAVADRVMRMRDADVSTSAISATGATGTAMRQPMDDQEEEIQMKQAGDTALQLKGDAGFAAAPAPDTSYAAKDASRSGSPLPPELRAFFEPRFGADFSAIRIHADDKAHAAAKSINARAFTLGNDIAFARGEYTPDTGQGRRLLAHELTHTLQQSGGRQTVQRAPAGGGGFAVTYNGCDKSPYDKATVTAAVKAAYDKVKTTECIPDTSFRESILGQFNGLSVDCEQNKEGPCGKASRYFTQTVNIYPASLEHSTCGPLASTILHEIIHLLEWAPFGHGDLAGACEKSCFNYGSGDASKCTAPAPPVKALDLNVGLTPGGLSGVGFEATALAGIPLEISGKLSAFAGTYSNLILGLGPNQRRAFMLGGMVGIGAHVPGRSGSLDVSAQARGGVGSLDLSASSGRLSPTLFGRLAVDYSNRRLSASGEALVGRVFSGDRSAQTYFGIGLRFGYKF